MALVEERWTRERAAFVSTIVLASVGLLVFGIWCVSLVSNVRQLRTEVEERVYWMQTVREIRDAASRSDPGDFQAATAVFELQRPGMELATRDDPAWAAALRTGTTALDDYARGELPGPQLERALDPMVPALRRQTAQRSVDLGEHWDSLYTLVGVSLGLGATALALLIYARLISVAKARSDVARLQAQLLRADRLAALGTLAATVAHEINNPLSYVLTNLDLLRDRLHGGALRSPGGDDIGSWLDDARQGARRVATIVRDLRSFSHPGAAAQRQSLDVHVSLDAAVRITKGEARDRARIKRRYDAVPRVLANDAQLGQVFLNLLVNAAQAIDRGSPESNLIEVSTHVEQGQVVIEISDTGRGIDPADAQRIFEPFVTTKHVGEGTGLGLYVCKGIVEGLGGSLQLLARDGGGTRARVTLPAADDSEVLEDSISIHPPHPEPLRRLRILIVDDEELLAAALARSLSRHDVRTTSDGSDATRLALTQPFDLILCDLIMPNKTGMEVFEEVCAERPELAERFVFMTGATVTGRAEAFASTVHAPVLQKPFSREELHDALSRYL